MAFDEPIEFNIHGPMISGSEQAEIRTYKLLTGKSGRRWLVAIQPNAADNIYVEGRPGSDGFGGRTINFPLETGETLALTGPWKTGADALLNDTGHDVTETHSSQGIIALEREYPKQFGQPCTYRGVLFYDDAPVLRALGCVEEMAQEFANDLNTPVHYAEKGYGGGSMATIKPKTPQPVEELEQV